MAKNAKIPPPGPLVGLPGPPIWGLFWAEKSVVLGSFTDQFGEKCKNTPPGPLVGLPGSPIWGLFRAEKSVECFIVNLFYSFPTSPVLKML